MSTIRDAPPGRPPAAPGTGPQPPHHAHTSRLPGRTAETGAGTGQFAVPAARRFGQVIAADVSPAMVAALRRMATANGLHNLACVRAGFLSYEHAGPPADGVYTRNALHQVPDFWTALALRRIADMLRPGGVLRPPAGPHLRLPACRGERRLYGAYTCVKTRS